MGWRRPRAEENGTKAAARVDNAVAIDKTLLYVEHSQDNIAIFLLQDGMYLWQITSAKYQEQFERFCHSTTCSVGLAHTG